MFGTGLTSNAIGQYFVPVTSELGLGMGQFTIYYAMRGVFVVFSTTMLNRWLEKFEIRVLVMSCFGVQLICTALMGTFTAVWQWYIIGAVMGFFLAPVYYILPPIVLSNWFNKKRGLVIGIAISFTGIGGIIMNPILASIIHNFGWRAAYFINAIIAGVIVLPFLLLLRKKPADKGLEPYGSEEREPKMGPDGKDAAVVNPDPHKGVSRDVAVHSFSFILLIVLCIIFGFYAGYPQHLTAYGISIGYSATFASYFLSLNMLGNVLTKLTFGFISDRFGGKAMIYTALCIIMASFLLLLVGGRYLPALFIGSLLGGCLLSISSVGTPLMLQAVYGARDSARIFLLISLGQNLFVSLGPSIVGFMFDHSGGYAFPLTVGAIVTVAAFILVFSSFLTSRKLPWS